MVLYVIKNRAYLCPGACPTTIKSMADIAGDLTIGADTWHIEPGETLRINHRTGRDAMSFTSGGETYHGGIVVFDSDGYPEFPREMYDLCAGACYKLAKQEEEIATMREQLAALHAEVHPDGMPIKMKKEI